MCTYCLIADWANKWIPDQPQPWSPWHIPVQPLFTCPPMVSGPHPVAFKPWTREQLEEFEGILRLVKEMEDKLGGCPCEDASKLDFLNDIRTRLNRTEGKE